MPDPRFKSVKEFETGYTKKDGMINSRFLAHRYEGPFTLEEVRKFFKYKSDKLKQQMPESRYIGVVMLCMINGAPKYISSKFVPPGSKMKLKEGSGYEKSIEEVIHFDIIFHVPSQYLKKAVKNF